MHLHRRLEEVLGPEEAATFMELVPPIGWADVATKRDLDHQVAILRVELDQLESGLRAEISDTAHSLRSEISDTAHSVRSEIKDLRSEMKDGFATVQRDMRLQLMTVLAFNLSLFGAAVGLLSR